jgi:hypothetical protein
MSSAICTCGELIRTSPTFRAGPALESPQDFHTIEWSVLGISEEFMAWQESD